MDWKYAIVLYVQSVTRSCDIRQLASNLELMPVMASGLVTAGLDSIFTGLSEKSQKALTQVKNMIDINFDQFVIELISALESTFRSSKSNVCSSSVAREKLWTVFHSARVTVLGKILKVPRFMCGSTGSAVSIKTL